MTTGMQWTAAQGSAAASGRLARAAGFVRAKGAAIGVEILVNLALPFLIYDQGERAWGQVHALMASSVPPLAWTLFEFARRRRIDAISILVLTGIGLSLLAFWGGGSARFLQLRERLATALVGLAFLGSAAIGRPLFHQLARASVRRRDPAGLDAFEALKDDVHFRRTMMTMTLVWGTVLVAEAALSAVLVLTLSVRQYMLAGHALGYGVIGALGLWSFAYAGHRRRRSLARRAAERAADATVSAADQAHDAGGSDDR